MTQKPAKPVLVMVAAGWSVGRANRPRHLQLIAIFSDDESFKGNKKMKKKSSLQVARGGINDADDTRAEVTTDVFINTYTSDGRLLGPLLLLNATLGHPTPLLCYGV